MTFEISKLGKDASFCCCCDVETVIVFAEATVGKDDAATPKIVAIVKRETVFFSQVQTPV